MWVSISLKVSPLSRTRSLRSPEVFERQLCIFLVSGLSLSLYLKPLGLLLTIWNPLSYIGQLETIIKVFAEGKDGREEGSEGRREEGREEKGKEREEKRREGRGKGGERREQKTCLKV